MSTAVLYFSRVSFSQSRIIVQGEDAFSSSGSDGWDISWDNGSDAGVILDLGSAPAGIYRILEIPMNAGSATADSFALSINDIPLASLTLPGSADHTLRIDFDLGSIEIRDSAGSVVDSAGLPADFPVETLFFLGIEFANRRIGRLLSWAGRFSARLLRFLRHPATVAWTTVRKISGSQRIRRWRAEFPGFALITGSPPAGWVRYVV
jgi:hypothetical protein